MAKIEASNSHDKLAEDKHPISKTYKENDISMVYLRKKRFISRTYSKMKQKKSVLFKF